MFSFNWLWWSNACFCDVVCKLFSGGMATRASAVTGSTQSWNSERHNGNAQNIQLWTNYNPAYWLLILLCICIWGFVMDMGLKWYGELAKILAYASVFDAPIVQRVSELDKFQSPTQWRHRNAHVTDVHVCKQRHSADRSRQRRQRIWTKHRGYTSKHRVVNT